MIEIKLKRLPIGEGLPLPAYATEHAAGLDVVAAEDLTLEPGGRHAVATGFALAIPEGFEVQVRPEAIAAGFYRRLQGLQGRNRTYYSGAAFHSHNSTRIWNGAETLLPRIAG